MSDNTVRMSYPFAKGLAFRMLELLSPVCQRIEIAGSIRRQKETIGDIEIVLIPKPIITTNLFGEVSVLGGTNNITEKLLDAGYKLLKNGERFKQCDMGECNCDIFIIHPVICKCGIMITNHYGNGEENENKQKRSSELCEIPQELQCMREVLPGCKSENMQQELRHETVMDGRTQGREQGDKPSTNVCMCDMREEISEQANRSPENVFEGVHEKTSGDNNDEKTQGTYSCSVDKQRGLSLGMESRNSNKKGRVHTGTSSNHAEYTGKKIEADGNNSPSEWNKERQSSRESRDSDLGNSQGGSNLSALREDILDKVVCLKCNNVGWYAPTWGMIFTIRTGPADFSHRLVTPRNQGGLLPSYLKVKDGRIWNGNEVLETAEERDVFRACNLDWIEPRDRK